MKNKFFWLFIFFLIGLGTSIYFFYFASFFQVKEVKIIGLEKISKESIEQLIEANLNQKIMFFKSKSIFLLKPDKLKEDLLKKFPELSSLVLKRKAPNVLSVKAEERKPLGVWCQGEKCFSFDKNGIIFEENSSEQKLIVKSEKNKGEILLGEKAIEEVVLNSILEIQKRLNENLKLEIKEFIVFEKEKLAVKTTEDWQVYFNPTGDLDWQLTKLTQVLEKKIPPEKRGKLEYIELRFGNLAPYKYR